MSANLNASVWIDFGASSANNFIIEDPSGHSVLDSTTYTLAASNWVDVTQYVSGQISTSRGRSREVDAYGAGTCSFQLRNEGRIFDPSNSSTTTPLTLRAEVYISIMVDGQAVGIYDGFIEDFDISYEMPNTSIINVNCVDAFSVLSNVSLTGTPSTAGTTTSQAFIDAMVATNVQLPYSASTGSTKVAGNTQSNVGLLDYIQTLARSEQGAVYVDQYGAITFLGRHSTFGPSGLTFTDSQSAIAADTSDSIFGYSTVSQRAASLLLFNTVTGTRTGGTLETATDYNSQSLYMSRNLDLGTLENDTDADVLNLVNYVLGKYATPELRFDAISMEVQGLSHQQVVNLAQLNLTATVPVTLTPGSGSAITRQCVIEGISWTLDASSSSYRVSFNLGSADVRNFLILDDAVFGILNTSKLDY